MLRLQDNEDLVADAPRKGSRKQFPSFTLAYCNAARDFGRAFLKGQAAAAQRFSLG